MCIHVYIDWLFINVLTACTYIRMHAYYFGYLAMYYMHAY